MPSADPGAPTVRPADVERWLSDLGLEPVDRAERDGIASWDLVLDGRRRFDLRVTVILDPSLALICWAHFAPPIGDMFRKSYRKLLRWNDEFPFAKFGIGEDERPLLSVELPIADVEAARTADRLGLALARIVGIADRLLDESAGLAVDRRSDARPVGPDAAQCRVPRRGIDDASWWSSRPRSSRPRRSRPRRSATGEVVRDGVSGPAGLRSSSAGRRRCRGDRRSWRRPADVRAATPDLTIVAAARYDVAAGAAADPRHGRPDAAQSTARTRRPAGTSSIMRSWPCCRARAAIG